MLHSELIAKMPKVELHCHLDGSLSLACIKQLAKNDGQSLPATDAEILEKAQAPETTRNLLEYLQRFDFVLPLLQSYRNLEIAAYDVVQQAAKDNVKYIEIRFAPAQHLQKNLTLEEAVEAVIAGLARAEQDFDITANALICGLKHQPLSELEKLLPLFDTISDEKLVGFDLAGDEVNYPEIKFEKIISAAKNSNIHITLHAGECPHCEQNIIDAVELGATRIGHGVMSKDITAYWETLIEKNIVLEMAPTSNFQTKSITALADYPFKKFYDAGLHVTLNTDNRTVSNTNLQQEYTKIADWYDFQVSDFEKINHYAIDGAFIPEIEKIQLHNDFTADYAKLIEK
ncbi:adenosine deaminase [Lactococcus nasutitermitis]|uniref:Adenosine deaminase n=1 Tax=Lactococcus nasutitermitis TaxID=1652957 RepID=A0ABV9JIS4_9LACT|nr:adenosine deaminase [Lactococcus nasutitermitis]